MGEEFRSLSVQLRVTPLGKVELLSTHDQLGGLTGQLSRLRFPGRHSLRSSDYTKLPR